jgi:hypothetical protein
MLATARKGVGKVKTYIVYMYWTMKFGCRSKLFFRAATVVAIWILCWVCVMGIPCWSAQVSLVEAVEAQQVRLQVTSTTAASHIPAPRSSKKKPHLLVPLAFAPSFSGNVSI